MHKCVTETLQRDNHTLVVTLKSYAAIYNAQGDLVGELWPVQPRSKWQWSGYSTNSKGEVYRVCTIPRGMNRKDWLRSLASQCRI